MNEYQENGIEVINWPQGFRPELHQIQQLFPGRVVLREGRRYDGDNQREHESWLVLVLPAGTVADPRHPDDDDDITTFTVPNGRRVLYYDPAFNIGDWYHELVTITD